MELDNRFLTKRCGLFAPYTVQRSEYDYQLTQQKNSFTPDKRARNFQGLYERFDLFSLKPYTIANSCMLHLQNMETLRRQGLVWSKLAISIIPKGQRIRFDFVFTCMLVPSNSDVLSASPFLCSFLLYESYPFEVYVCDKYGERKGSK